MAGIADVPQIPKTVHRISQAWIILSTIAQIVLPRIFDVGRCVGALLLEPLPEDLHFARRELRGDVRLVRRLDLRLDAPVCVARLRRGWQPGGAAEGQPVDGEARADQAGWGIQMDNQYGYR